MGLEAAAPGRAQDPGEAAGPRGRGWSTAALVRDTFREAFARKVFWGFFGCSTALIVFVLFILRIDIVEGGLAAMSLFGKTREAMDAQRLVGQAHAAIAAFLYSAGMFLAVFASAGLIPAVFEPGRIELLLSKPLARHRILLGRYLGNLLVVAVNLFYLVGTIWIIFGWKTGVWTAGFLLAAVVTLFTFAVLLALIVLVSALCESAAVATMATFGVMLLSPVLAQRRIIERLLDSEWSRDTVRVLYAAFPKIFELGGMVRELALGRGVESWAPVWSSALFGAAALAAGLAVFSRRDY
ncbi:MAG: hypothetical protein FJW37_13205 [Acidobacteria bacterium]|nr:hypothetical protein [Acidobacteriota bacterium]